MPLGGWPSIADDTGTKTDGTILNKAIFDAIKASVEASVFVGSVDAAAIITEVTTARGTQASLDARLDVELNNDGTLKSLIPVVVNRQSGSLTSTTTPNAAHTWVMSANTMGADGDFLDVEASGALADNANAKSIKVYIGTNSVTVLTDNAALGGINKFVLRLRMTRVSPTSFAVDGIVTFHAVSGGAPTVWHLGGNAAGGSTDFTIQQDVKVELVAPTANSDITLVRTVITLVA